ncbi:MAG: hemolysin family protein [Calditrichaceae bacterium]|jgi:CBS domain containing-hemolysin-like protein
MIEIYLAIFGLILSFFFAGSEAAFTKFNRLRLEVWKKRQVKLSKNASIFVKAPEKFFSTILVGNNFANILYTTFATVVFIGYLNKSISWIIIMAVVLFIGEILPKTLFRSVADRIILQTLLIVRIFYILLKPIIEGINYLVESILKVFNLTSQNFSTYFSREEMELLLSTGYKTKTKDSQEQKYILKILGFSESKVREAMIPRTDIIACSKETNWDELEDLMYENKKMRIPVYDKDLDNIMGVAFMYDVINNKEKDINTILKQVPFIPDNKNCLELLREFQEKNISTAIVLDEYGGTAGMVTTDDLIEEVFGDFTQIGELTPQIKALNKFTWVIDAKVELDELSELIGLDFESNESETLAGYILENQGKIPKAEEIIEFDGFRIEILEATEKRIDKVKLILEKSIIN